MSNKPICERKLEIINQLVVNLSARKSRFDDACPELSLTPEERKAIFQDVLKMDKKIDATIDDARKILSPLLDDYHPAEICFLLYIFSSAFTTNVPSNIDSRDLDLICLHKPTNLCKILDSVDHGELFVHIEKSAMKRGIGWDFEVRSFTLLNKFLMSDEEDMPYE